MAPLGFSLDPDNQRFTSLLNTWGYYIERNDDSQFVPAFVSGAPGWRTRNRYRLMEFRPPTENMAVYAADLKNGYKTDWFKAFIPEGESKGVPMSRPIAENIIALIIEPMESQVSGSNNLSPNYEYDSRFFQKGGGDNHPTKHQLPPLVRITMVAIDEDSAIRYEQVTGGEIDNLVPTGLFKNTSSFEVDLRTLKQKLDDQNLEYRVFTETVAIRASKFSDSAFQ